MTDLNRFEIVSIDDLGYDELIELEERANVDMSSFDGSVTMRIQKAVVWLSARRTNPELSWEDAGKIPVSALMGLVDAEDPTDPKG